MHEKPVAVRRKLQPPNVDDLPAIVVSHRHGEKLRPPRGRIRQPYVIPDAASRLFNQPRALRQRLRYGAIHPPRVSAERAAIHPRAQPQAELAPNSPRTRLRHPQIGAVSVARQHRMIKYFPSVRRPAAFKQRTLDVQRPEILPFQSYEKHFFPVNAARLAEKRHDFIVRRPGHVHLPAFRAQRLYGARGAPVGRRYYDPIVIRVHRVELVADCLAVRPESWIHDVARQHGAPLAGKFIPLGGAVHMLDKRAVALRRPDDVRDPEKLFVRQQPFRAVRGGRVKFVFPCIIIVHASRRAHRGRNRKSVHDHLRSGLPSLRNDADCRLTHTTWKLGLGTWDFPAGGGEPPFALFLYLPPRAFANARHRPPPPACLVRGRRRTESHHHKQDDDNKARGAEQDQAEAENESEIESRHTLWLS